MRLPLGYTPLAGPMRKLAAGKGVDTAQRAAHAERQREYIADAEHLQRDQRAATRARIDQAGGR